MAGWRAPQAGESDEPIELVDDGDRSEVEVAGGRAVDWHATLRTGAAVVAALALVWLAQSSARDRAAREQGSCASDIQTAMWRYENVAAQDVQFGPPRIPDDVMVDLIAHARECGDELFADALEYERLAAAERARERDNDR